MKHLFILFLGLISTWSFSQEKKTFQSVDQILKSINPNGIKSWVLYKNNQKIKSVGNVETVDFKNTGFQLDPTEKIFYRIAYREKQKVKKVENITDLISFIGKIDNPEESAIKAISEGYFVDMEYKNLAASYTENKEHYLLKIGKITSEKCPFEKKSFSLTIEKKSGKMISTKENEKYTEVYLKDCKNNPHRFIPPKKKKEKKIISIYR